MAAVNFPNSPSVNDTHTSSGSTWKWDGGVWQRLGVAGPQGAQGVQGAQGHQGVQGAQGHQGVQGSQGVQGAVNNLTIATSPPGSPSAGDMWWDSDDGDLHTYFNDGNSSQWVNINNGPAGAQGAQGAQGHQGVQGATGSSATINNNANNRVITGGSGTTLEAESGLTFDGSTVKLLNASVPQIRINNDTSDGSSTRLMIGKATASNNFFNGAASGDSCISAPGNLLLGVTSSEKVRITSTGAKVSGTLDLTGDLYWDGDTDTNISNASTANWLRFKCGGSTALDLTDNADVKIHDSKKLKLGASDDIQIYHNSGNDRNYFFSPQHDVYHEFAVSNSWTIQTTAGDKRIVCQKNSTSTGVELYWNGTKQCETTTNGLKFPSGKGIDFSSNTAGGGTATGTLLEDYEEGTYSSSIVSSNCTLDSSSGTGYYIKVGNMVYVRGLFSMNTQNGSPSKSGSDNIVQALPYTPKSGGTSMTGTMIVENINSGAPTSSVGHPLWYNVLPSGFVCLAGSNGIRFYINKIEAAYVRMNNSHLNVGYPGYTWMSWNVVYETN